MENNTTFTITISFDSTSFFSGRNTVEVKAPTMSSLLAKVKPYQQRSGYKVEKNIQRK